MRLRLCVHTLCFVRLKGRKFYKHGPKVLVTCKDLQQKRQWYQVEKVTSRHGMFDPCAEIDISCKKFERMCRFKSLLSFVDTERFILWPSEKYMKSLCKVPKSTKQNLSKRTKAILLTSAIKLCFQFTNTSSLCGQEISFCSHKTMKLHDFEFLIS